jgi:hypothetical protein
MKNGGAKLVLWAETSLVSEELIISIMIQRELIDSDNAALIMSSSNFPLMCYNVGLWPSPKI